MIHLCTERVITALLSVEKKYITWPSELERKHICATMMNSLPGCIGYMDGTHIPLFEAPLQDHEASVSVGYPASAHDARVFANSPIGLHPENYLSDGQWIAGDSAYRCNRYVVTPFRENSNVNE
ncbi:uncharacterized protein LOC112455918 [Temnothorax curvispinosus]|uniref:Uncharacterized protein LOC112455918 n=1 Tax=Temnothorax curvispinosus TaxID=300111 RepID=A0A6J1PX19_9HYME|nr:uncharacterized protein LOC112455918 [Temnothorax curvispinosus]